MKASIYNNFISVFIMMAIMLSCENPKNDRASADSETIEGIEQARDIDESYENDYMVRRNRAVDYINNQIEGMRMEQDSIRQIFDKSDGEEKAAMEERMTVLERRKENLQNQRDRLSQGNMVDLESVERELDSILVEGVETPDMDREVRGAGTTLDGPNLNRTGTRTGTEIEKRQREVEEDTGQHNPENQQ